MCVWWHWAATTFKCSLYWCDNLSKPAAPSTVSQQRPTALQQIHSTAYHPNCPSATNLMHRATCNKQHLAIISLVRRVINLPLHRTTFCSCSLSENGTIIAGKQMNPIGKSWLGEGLAGLVSGLQRQETDTAWFLTASGSNLGQDQEWRYSTNLSWRPSPEIFLHRSAPSQKFISRSSHIGWAGSWGLNVVRRVTRPSLCGVPVIWVNFKLGSGFSTPLWPAILSAHINTWWSHWSWGKRALWNHIFRLSESKHYGDRELKQKHDFLMIAGIIPTG